MNYSEWQRWAIFAHRVVSVLFTLLLLFAARDSLGFFLAAFIGTGFYYLILGFIKLVYKYIFIDKDITNDRL